MVKCVNKCIEEISSMIAGCQLEFQKANMTMTNFLIEGTCILFVQVYNKKIIKQIQKNQVQRLKPK